MPEAERDYTKPIAALLHANLAPSLPLRDAELLGLAENIAELNRREKDIRDAIMGARWDCVVKRLGDDLVEIAAIRKRVLRAAGRLQAESPAGIFAKARIIVTGSRDTSALNCSLARDLLASPQLRRALWPAVGEAV